MTYSRTQSLEIAGVMEDISIANTVLSWEELIIHISSPFKAAFTPRRTNVECLANQRLYFARDGVSDWLGARHLTFVRLGVNSD
ncbi:hypothetical protein TNCV_302461 [Trichonephila clavipes]|nr:hypothetical protein TNCV_302461 [Trichonephila clavipes]